MDSKLPTRHVTRWLEWLLLAAAVSCLGIWSWTWLDASAFDLAQGWHLDEILARESPHQRTSSLRRTASATRREILASGLIGRIELPRLGIRSLVSEGTDALTLRRAVGHVPATSLPGEPGNVVIAGHRDSFFSRLEGVLPGDLVRLTTPDGTFVYAIASMRVVGPEHTEVLAATSLPTLTLITCYPFHFLGPAPERYVVIARQLPPSPEPSSRASLGGPMQASVAP